MVIISLRKSVRILQYTNWQHFFQAPRRTGVRPITRRSKGRNIAFSLLLVQESGFESIQKAG